MKIKLHRLGLNDLLDRAVMSEILCLNNIHYNFAEFFEVHISLIIHSDSLATRTEATFSGLIRVTMRGTCISLNQA